MLVTIPNLITLLRILLLPVFVITFYLPVVWANVLCALIFAIAALSDWIDGYLARRLGQISAFGTFFDPVADKLIVAVALVLLVGRHGTAFLAIPAAVIIGREIMVSALREWMAEIGKRKHIAVVGLGKYKTAAQMGAIILLLLAKTNDSAHISVVIGGYGGYILLYLAAILTLWSMLVYLSAAWPSLMHEEE